MAEPRLELRLEGVDLDGPDERPVFRALHLNLAPGDALLVKGATGYARGQLLKLAAGLIRPNAGSCWINGRQLWPGEGLAATKGFREGPRLGLCFARGGLVANLSLADNLELPALFSTSRATAEIRATCQDLLARFGLTRQAGLRPFALDSRTRKLANLIRIRLLEPDLIFLDDPLAELAAEDLPEIEVWLREWTGDGRRMLLASACEQDPEPPGTWHYAKLKDGRLEACA